MVAGIEFGTGYAQLCVQTERMKEPESVSMVAGREEYRMTADSAIEDKEETEKIFRRCLKFLKTYGTLQQLRFLVFCIEENTKETREMLLHLAEIYNIAPERIRFIDKKESFCTYLFHQPGELLARGALLIENLGLQKQMLLFHKGSGAAPVAAQVRDVSDEEIEDVLSAHGISSIFLVGDFPKEWMERYLKLFKSGRRIFAGKNLYVKGAALRAAELWKNGKRNYFYIGEGTVRCSIALKAGANAQELLTLSEAGGNWYESDTETDVLLLSGRELEFVLIPFDKKERTQVVIPLEGLPERPPKTTRLRVSLEFTGAAHAKLAVRDLGFGELFAQSDMVYKGELQWEQ